MQASSTGKLGPRSAYGDEYEEEDEEDEDAAAAASNTTSDDDFLDGDSRFRVLFRRFSGASVSAAAAAAAFLSPPAMALLPLTGFMGFREAQLRCNVCSILCIGCVFRGKVMIKLWIYFFFCLTLHESIKIFFISLN